jgi:cysteine desulfurase
MKTRRDTVLVVDSRARMIYLDHAASTPPAADVLDAMTQAAREHFANPSSAHALGAAAARALEQARQQVAALLAAEPAEVVFTSGGTEADALGVIGGARGARGRHLVVSAIEHPAVLRSVQQLAGDGYEVSLVAPGRNGILGPAEVAAAIRPDTALCAVMLVNNELGTLQPVAEIARAVRSAGFAGPIHCDAVQAAGLLPVQPRSLGVDTLAISAHKFRGPRGAGALWVRAGARIRALWDGGRQERGLRSGTENLPAFAGMARAALLARSMAPNAAAIGQLRDRLEAAIATRLPHSRPTVPAGTARAPHIASVLLPDLPAEPILHALEARGVHASAGSACATRSRQPSHVLRAIGVTDDAAVLRFSLGPDTTEAEVMAAAAALAEATAEVAEVAALSRPGRRRAP